MPSCAVRSFTDPDAYAQTVRNANAELTTVGRGRFAGEIVAISLHRMWMQRFSDSLPRVAYVTNAPGRLIINFRAQPGPPLLTGGLDLQPHTILRYAEGQTYFQRSDGASVFCAMSLPVEDVAAIASTLRGVDLKPPRDPASLVPRPAALARLHRLHAAAVDLAGREPHVISNNDAAHAMEQELAHAMVDCLVPADVTPGSMVAARRTGVMKRFRALLDARPDDALHLPELCQALGVSDRTLWTCCHEALGVSPMHYLWLRRMNQTRRALLHADPATATVTGIATAQGFWELGRFAVQYRTLFGERPSATLSRPASD